MKTIRYTCVVSAVFTGLLIGLGDHAAPAPVTELWVSPQKGRDRNRATKASPVKTISAAIAKIPDPVTESVTVYVLPGDCSTTGGRDMADETLELMRRMRPGVSVTFKGSEGGRPLFAWAKNTPTVIAIEGHWGFEHIKIGSGSQVERRGVVVEGPAVVTLNNCRFRLRSDSDSAIVARRGGHVRLRGVIEINEDLHDTEKPTSFSGILAEDHGVVEFVERKGARLDIGNGSLRTRHYGIIRLGCEEARISNWSKGSNNLSIANGGRIDLRNTKLTLHAHNEKNTPIGLEHDGHILAEDARIVITGRNDSAIALQKASTLTCNDIDLRGQFGFSLWATSGSMFVGRFLSDVKKLDARTGATIHLEKIVEGKTVDTVTAESGGLISLPDVIVRSK